MPAGISIGDVYENGLSAGTLGAFVRSTKANEADFIYILSNNHVLAGVDRNPPGTVIYQPGRLDAGTPADAVARLDRVVKIDMNTSKQNLVDAAIAKLTIPASQIQASICSIGPITGTVEATKDLLVAKHGRTTGYTEGVISEDRIDVIVDSGGTESACLIDQIQIAVRPPYAMFGDSGDSGSLIVTQSTHEAVGLYFAGPEDGTYGLANPIRKVLDLLKIRFA